VNVDLFYASTEELTESCKWIPVLFDVGPKVVEN
jgi:hypothetical protein